MLRGLLLGASWGGLIAVTAVTAVSLSFGDVSQPKMTEAAQPVQPAQPVRPATPETVAPVAEAVPDSVVVTPQEVTEAPTPPAVNDNDVASAAGDTATDQSPDVMIPAEENAQTALITVETPDETAQSIGAADTPVESAASAAMPQAPQPEVQPKAELQAEAMTTPAMQDAPAEGDAGQADMPVDAPDVQVAALPQILTPDQPETPPNDAPLVVPSPADASGAQSPKMIVPDGAAPDTGVTPDTAQEAPKGQPDTPRAELPKLTNLAPNVKTNRLPTIGGTAEADVVEVGQEVTQEADKVALSAYAMPFENPDAKPMFSVILIDDPDHPLSDDVLSHLPFALSFAIDAVRDDAHAVAARYRAAGFEVLMLTNLPFGASAADVEVAFGAYERAIPEAVGVLDLGGNGFLRGPNTATQIAGIMSEKGFGLITPSKGLNSAQKAAMREGVPAALVYRDLDSDAEKPAVIRRYLDRAAFRAAQEGSVIMLGHTRGDTIEALVTWALEDRAGSVAMAPVSAVLLAQ